MRGSGGLLLSVMSDCQHVEWTDSGVVATSWRLRRFLGLWCAGIRMARWQRVGLDKSVVRADVPCGGVAVAGARRPCGGGRPCGGVGGPTGRPCGGEGQPRCLGHCWAAWRSTPGAKAGRRGVCWYLGKNQRRDASTSAKSKRFRREVGHVASSSLAGVPGNIAREGFAVPSKTATELGFGSFPKTAPERFQKDAWRHQGDCVEMKQSTPSRRSRQMDFIVSFPVLPLRAF
jgi:hypothetical protein